MTDETVFAAAMAIADPVARLAYLDRACAGKPELRREVEGLLAAHDASNPLDRSPADLGLTGAYERAKHSERSVGVGDRIGPYKLLEQIGEGGMGEVWVADQLEPIKRRVALKLIKPGMDSRSVLGRFEAERQALAVMDHPNIAKVLDAGTTADARPYFVMELVKGTPITEFCDARNLTPKQRLELFVPVCQAIQHAHMKGIIHRDIKPSNVLVALHDETPVPKVIDFGVAKAVGQQLTEKTIYTGFGSLIGTPAYMAPEQATFNQLDVDTRADVYALGVVLYELLAGSPPIDVERMKRSALDEILRIVRDEEPPRPSQRLSTSHARASIAATRQTDPGKLSQLMRGELDWIVMKALDKDRTRRYETANGFAADVQRYLKGEAVQAHPPSTAYRLRKFVRRNKATASTIAIVAWALFMGFSLAAIGFFKAENERKKAELALNTEAEMRRAADQSAANAIEARNREVQQLAKAEQLAIAARTDFEIEQRARRRIRSVYRTSSINLFLTAFLVDGDGVELIRFRNESWRAIHLLRMLTDDYTTEAGTSPAARAIRAEGLVWRGVDCYGKNEYSNAFDWFRQAEAIIQELVAASPSAGDARADLANCRMLAAFAARSSNHGPEADRFVTAAEADARNLLADFPNNPEYRFELALVLWQMPALRRMAGEENPDPPQLRESKAILESLVRRSPDVLQYRTGLANVLLAMASERKRAKKYADAIPLFGESLTVLDGVPANQVREPIPTLRKWALRGRARALGELGKHAEAASDWARVVVEAPEPIVNPVDRSEWAYALALSGDMVSARAEAERVAKSSTLSSGYRNAARVFALSVKDLKAAPADREAWAAQAVSLLRRASDTYSHPDDYLVPTFDALKDRKDFREFIEGLRRKANGKE